MLNRNQCIISLIKQRERKKERGRENGLPPVHRVPVYPSGQMHSKLPSRFLQVPPFRQGNCMHSLKSAKMKISFLLFDSCLLVNLLSFLHDTSGSITDITEWTHPALRTLTGEGAWAVNTATSVETRVHQALVDICNIITT